MRKILLASVGVMVMSAGMSYAACIPTPDCASLGYESSSSCEGGIKCPFGNAWNCTVINKVNEITNKVTELEKVIEEGGGDTSNCILGSIFYSDHTCSYGAVLPTKTPIGVVVYVDGQGHGQVMALNSIGSYIWSRKHTNISTLQDFASDSAASQDLASCENTEKIIAEGDKDQYPAAWAVHEYKTEGTNAGDWCLPAAGIMTSINNGMELINIGYSLVKGTKIETSSSYWTSSEYNGNRVWTSAFLSDYGVNINFSNSYENTKEQDYDVRPVLEF